MDRVVLGGCFLLMALGVLIGLGISAEKTTGDGIRGALELLSFAGTAVTGVVAIIALDSWIRQFRHAEKFKSLKELQSAAVELFHLVNYLESVFHNNWSQIENGLPDELSRANEAEARQKWLAALSGYSRAWSSAVVFLSNEEEANFPWLPDLFSIKAREFAVMIVLARANSPAEEKYKNILSVADEVSNSARDLHRSTTEAVRKMLVRHAVK